MNCSVCSKKLNKHNKIGVCRQHRNMSPAKQAYMREYKAKNADILKAKKKAFRIKNKEAINKDWQTRFNTDLNFRIAHNLRTRIGKFFTRGDKKGSAVKDLGCSVAELKTYLESKFQPGMSWENWGVDGWHVDHIKALSLFDLTDSEQFKQAAHYTNLQPMWADENISKGGSNRIKNSQECSASLKDENVR